MMLQVQCWPLLGQHFISVRVLAEQDDGTWEEVLCRTATAPVGPAVRTELDLVAWVGETLLDLAYR